MTHEEKKLAALMITLKDLLNWVLRYHANDLAAGHEIEPEAQCPICRDIWFAVTLERKMEQDHPDHLKGYVNRNTH